MTTRDIRQQEAVDAYLNSDRRSIINACPRFGKIKVALDIITAMKAGYIWLLAPRNDIFVGWEADMDKFGVNPRQTKMTFTSIKKLENLDVPDLIIMDEPHEASVNQQVKLHEVLLNYPEIPMLGLTGTLTNKTKNELYDNLNLDTCYTYSISQGVEEGVLADYQMIVHKVNLDNGYKMYGKLRNQTEKKWFDSTMYIKETNSNPKTKHLMNLRAINIIQNSLGKLSETQRLIKEFEGERVLVFCGLTEIADALEIPVYHSKAREKDIFNDFCSGAGTVNQLATIKMMQAGVTITPINKGIINYMSGNPEDSAQKICRFLGFEYDNPEKKAEIHIISTNEEFELSRLKTGLAFFDQSKIIFKT